MPSISSGLYKVEIQFLAAGGNPAVNRFWYRETLGADDKSLRLWLAFNTTIVPLLNGCHYPAYTADFLKVDPVFGTGTPEEGVPTATAGTLGLGTNPVAGHIAASIKLFRATKELRNGWKRISGLQEDYIQGNTISGDLLTSLNTLATNLSVTLTDSGVSFIPCLVRIPGTYAGGIQTGYTYTDISSAAAISDRVTTQNSRKLWN